jgi:hypothetical protein
MPELRATFTSCKHHKSPRRVPRPSFFRWAGGFVEALGAEISECLSPETSLSNLECKLGQIARFFSRLLRRAIIKCLSHLVQLIDIRGVPRTSQF